MKTFYLFAMLLSFATSPAWASPASRTAVYIVDETDYYSQQFRADCATAEEVARGKLPGVEKNLGVEPGTFVLNARIATLPMGPINPGAGMPPQRVRYQCLLQFQSKDKAVTFNVDTTKMKTHLSKDEWGTACKADFDELAAHPGALFTQYEMGFSLFQGRICDVGYVEALKKLL